MVLDPGQVGHGAAAGAVAAAAWAAQQPLDKRLFGCRYDDVELLGRMVRPRAGRHGWYPVGLAWHVGNGALFGAVYAAAVRPRLGGRLPPAAGGLLAAQAENFGSWPLARLSDRWHPARRELPRLTGNRRALWQATWRHALFGVLLGTLERRWNGDAAGTRSQSPPPAP